MKWGTDYRLRLRDVAKRNQGISEKYRVRLSVHSTAKAGSTKWEADYELDNKYIFENLFLSDESEVDPITYNQSLLSGINSSKAFGTQLWRGLT
jgi:hypothetical protein